MGTLESARRSKKSRSLVGDGNVSFFLGSLSIFVAACMVKNPGNLTQSTSKDSNKNRGKHGWRGWSIASIDGFMRQGFVNLASSARSLDVIA